MLLQRSSSWKKSDCSDIRLVIFFLTKSSSPEKYESTIRRERSLSSLILNSEFSKMALISFMEPSFYDCSTLSRIFAILFTHWFFNVLREVISAWVLMLRWSPEWFSTHYGHRGRTQLMAEQKLVKGMPSCSSQVS